MDPREKMALMAILRTAVLVLSLMIGFFMLKKGISLYEESIWIDNAESVEKTPVLQEIQLIEDFDIQNQDARELFKKRIEHWKEADRLVRSVDILLKRNIYDQAINQCQDALRRDPSHIGALDRLGQLYFAQESYVEAVNAYIRLLSVDPSRMNVKKRLIAALDAYGDHIAVRHMSEWYLEDHTFDVDVGRYLANAYFAQEEYEAAAEAYARVLRDSPKDSLALEQQAEAYMLLEQYEKALVPLEKLRENNSRNPVYFKQVAICYAQLENGQETVQTLQRAGQIFGQQMALGLVQEPKLDPVREDRAFQAFVDRIGGENFRTGIEELARKTQAKKKSAQEIDTQLKIPVSEDRDDNLLKLMPDK